MEQTEKYQAARPQHSSRKMQPRANEVKWVAYARAKKQAKEHATLTNRVLRRARMEYIWLRKSALWLSMSSYYVQPSAFATKRNTYINLLDAMCIELQNRFTPIKLPDTLHVASGKAFVKVHHYFS
jgi:hypothetical protein